MSSDPLGGKEKTLNLKLLNLEQQDLGWRLGFCFFRISQVLPASSCAAPDIMGSVMPSAPGT